MAHVQRATTTHVFEANSIIHHIIYIYIQHHTILNVGSYSIENDLSGPSSGSESLGGVIDRSSGTVTYPGKYE